jgi:glycosyltransferase involved in cell wall biosynthesis
MQAWGSDIMVAPKKSKLTKFLVNLALSKADVIITASDYLKEYLYATFNTSKDKVEVIPIGIDLDIFKKIPNVHDFTILSPRALTSHYRIENIVQAMPQVIAKYPSVALIILKGSATDNAYQEKIEQLIIDLGISQNVILTNKELSLSEMAEVYNASNVLVSIPKTDQFSSCIQEGMACGVIPIVGDLEVYKLYLTHGYNALFIDPESPESIANAVLLCIENPYLKERFYEINRQIIIENEDWSKNIKKLEELYNEYTPV